MVPHSVRRAKEPLDIQDDLWITLAGIRQIANFQGKVGEADGQAVCVTSGSSLA
jgi:hypothetical protein